MFCKYQVVKALIKKEIKQIQRDSSNLVVAFLLPLLLLLIFGYGISFDLEHVRVDLVLESMDRSGCDLADTYAQSKYFDANIVHLPEEAAGHMEAGTAQGIIVIPKNIPKNGLQIISDGSDPNTASYVEGYALGIFSKWLSRQNSTINIVDRLWFNPSNNTINFTMPGVLTMVLSIVGTFLTSLVVAKEWERGTMESLISTPITVWEIIISKIIPYFVLCSISVMLVIFYGIYFFKMPFEGSLWAMVILTTAFIIVSLLIGLIISISAKEQFVAAMGSSLVTFMPTMLLSGFIFEIKSMPKWIQVLTYCFPAKYYVSSVRTLLLVGDIWPILCRDLAVLLFMSLVLFFLFKKKLKKDVE
jgi:ABC-2 type transport system permease protein